jgi:hypothetical protein
LPTFKSHLQGMNIKLPDTLEVFYSMDHQGLAKR